MTSSSFQLSLKGTYIMILHAGYLSHCCEMPTLSDVFLSFSCPQNTCHFSQIVTLLNGITLKPCVKHLLLTELIHSNLPLACFTVSKWVNLSFIWPLHESLLTCRTVTGSGIITVIPWYLRGIGCTTPPSTPLWIPKSSDTQVPCIK